MSCKQITLANRTGSIKCNATCYVVHDSLDGNIARSPSFSSVTGKLINGYVRCHKASFAPGGMAETK